MRFSNWIIWNIKEHLCILLVHWCTQRCFALEAPTFTLQLLFPGPKAPWSLLLCSCSRMKACACYGPRWHCRAPLARVGHCFLHQGCVRAGSACRAPEQELCPAVQPCSRAGLGLHCSETRNQNFWYPKSFYNGLARSYLTATCLYIVFW